MDFGRWQCASCCLLSSYNIWQLDDVCGDGDVDDNDVCGSGVDHCAIDVTNSAAGNPQHSPTTHPNLQGVVTQAYKGNIGLDTVAYNYNLLP